MKTAKEIFQKLVDQVTGICDIFRRGSRKNEPGLLVKSLTPEERKTLINLTSEEASQDHLRFDQIINFCEDHWREKEKKEKIEKLWKNFVKDHHGK